MGGCGIVGAWEIVRSGICLLVRGEGRQDEGSWIGLDWIAEVSGVRRDEDGGGCVGRGKGKGKGRE